jgi:alpha-L-rhamnosidase
MFKADYLNKYFRIAAGILLSMTVSIFLYAGNRPSLSVSGLTTEGRDTLLGTDILQPRLSWKLFSDIRNLRQTAYRIWVAGSRETLQEGKADIWDSGKIESGNSINIVYRGRPLSSYQPCYWKVEVWTNDGSAAMSEPAYWSMGLLKTTDWQAQWIGLNGFNERDEPESTFTRLSARYLRKEFPTGKTIREAKAYISGLGLYELYLNGKKVGRDVLSPGITEYNKKIFYNTYDVTDYLRQGVNCVGVILGNGRFFGMRNNHGKPDPLTGIPQMNYGLPRLLMQMRIRYADGSIETVCSDKTWKLTDNGPILANNEFDGEEYDANKELTGWNQPGYEDGSWKQVDLMSPGNIRLVAQPNENIRIKQVLQPIRVWATSRGTYILDMGQNMVGWVALKVKGRKGDTVQMRFAEKIKGKDSLYLDNVRKAKVTDKYILKGGETEAWEPRFTYHGFRYVEVRGLHREPLLKDFEGKVIYDDVQTIGRFETSNPVINAVFRNAYWTIRGNYRSIPTDCPQRDERVGWLGDRVMSSYGESFLFDNSRLYAKWLDDIGDAQKENGSLPDIAPTLWYRYSDDVTYPSAFILIPGMLRRQFGDTVSISKHYPAMKKWMLYLWDTYQENDLVLKDTYGDWCVPPESIHLIWSQDPDRITSGGLIAAAYYYHCLGLMSDYANRLGRPEDAAKFDGIAQKLLTAFNRKFYNAETKSYSNNTVTANLLPLSFNMVPEQDRQAVFQNIRKRLKEFNDHVNSGIIGGMWLMRGLSDNGAPDLAYKLATNTTYPGWGYMVKQGATTIWELWNGDAANPMMNSGNHQMLLGDLLIWYYEYLAGIKTDDKEVAFKKIIMNPVFPAGLDYVNASLNTRYGEVKSAWKKSAGKLSWNISIPPNTAAEITLPATNIRQITEGGKALTQSPVRRITKETGGKIKLTVGSGNYRFVIRQ